MRSTTPSRLSAVPPAPLIACTSPAKVIHDYFVSWKDSWPQACHCCPQKTVDSPFGELWHDGWDAGKSIIMASIGTTKTEGSIIPELKEKLTGLAFHVCTSSMSAVHLTCALEKVVKYSEAVIIRPLVYTEDHVVAWYLNCGLRTFDAGAGIVLCNHFVRMISWYHSEFGYNNMTVLTVCMISKA